MKKDLKEAPLARTLSHPGYDNEEPSGSSYSTVDDSEDTTTTTGSSYSVYSVSSYSSAQESTTYSAAYSTHSSSYLAYSITPTSGKSSKEATEHGTPCVDVFSDHSIPCSMSLIPKEESHSWNGRFQYLLDRPESEEKYRLLSVVANDFVYCANTLGKIIISELNLPDESKTILPLGLGGVAGGFKYKCHDIIFKFVVDTEIAEGVWMYGESKRCDEKAQKSAGHELKGLNHYLEHSKGGVIRFPLMAIIDYRGYRLLAISNLPIGKNTIVYGSCDGGRTVHNSDPVVNEEMKRLASILNIKGHLVGLNSPPTLVYAPGDIEVHKGLDNRYYMIDFARAFPPEYPAFLKGKVGREIFYSMLRPELVTTSPVPLSPDAFSGWQSGKDEDESNKEVMDMTASLHTEVIPEFIRFIDTAMDADEETTVDGVTTNEASGTFIKEFRAKFGKSDYSKKTFELVRMINFIHSRGINLRYLGMICQRIRHRELRMSMLTEVVARVWKKIIRSRLREKMSNTNRPSEEPKQVIAEVFDILLNYQVKQKYTIFWSDTQPGSFKYAALRAFPRCLTPSEESSMYDLRLSLDIKLLVVRIIQIMNVRVNPQAYNQFMSNPRYVIAYRDIEEVESTVKYPAIIDYAAGSVLIFETERLANVPRTSPLEVARWVDLAQAKLHAALRSMPLSAAVTEKLASTYLLKSNVAVNVNDSLEFLSTASTMVRNASETHHLHNPQLLALLGMTHLKLATYQLFYNKNFVNFKRELDVAREKLELAVANDHSSVEMYLASSLPLEYVSCDAPSMDDTSKERRKLYELITLIYLSMECEPNSALKTFIPLVVGSIRQINHLEIPMSLTRIIDSSVVYELIAHLPNILRLEMTKISLNPMSAYAAANLKYLTVVNLTDVNVSTPRNPTPEDIQAIEAAGPEPIDTVNKLLRSILTNCPLLRSLSLCARYYDDETFTGLAPMLGNLTELSIYMGYISSKTVIEMAPYLTRLESLTLAHLNDVKDDAVVAVLSTSTELRELTLRLTLTDVAGQVIVARAPKLTTLSLSRARISAPILADIVRDAPLMQSLDLSGSSADNSVIQALESHGASHLTKLYLDSTSVEGDESLQILSAISPSLTVLNLARFNGEGRVFWSLMRKLPDLETLRMPPRSHLPYLMQEYASECDASEEVLSVPFANVSHLDLFMMTISVSALTSLLELCPAVESLSLSAVTLVNERSHVVELNDAILQDLGPLFYNLRDLNLSNLPIDKRQVTCLLSRCPSLRKIHLLNCKPITAQIAYDLGQENQHIIISN
eukprot:gene3664-4217_t